MILEPGLGAWSGGSASRCSGQGLMSSSKPGSGLRRDRQAVYEHTGGAAYSGRSKAQRDNTRLCDDDVGVKLLKRYGSASLSRLREKVETSSIGTGNSPQARRPHDDMIKGLLRRPPLKPLNRTVVRRAALVTARDCAVQCVSYPQQRMRRMADTVPYLPHPGHRCGSRHSPGWSLVSALGDQACPSRKGRRRIRWTTASPRAACRRASSSTARRRGGRLEECRGEEALRPSFMSGAAGRLPKLQERLSAWGSGQWTARSDRRPRPRSRLRA